MKSKTEAETARGWEPATPEKYYPTIIESIKHKIGLHVYGNPMNDFDNPGSTRQYCVMCDRSKVFMYLKPKGFRERIHNLLTKMLYKNYRD